MRPPAGADSCSEGADLCPEELSRLGLCSGGRDSTRGSGGVDSTGESRQRRGGATVTRVVTLAVPAGARVGVIKQSQGRGLNWHQLSHGPFDIV
eukprot:1180576-Prorocentrum_minimum.AAC.3